MSEPQIETGLSLNQVYAIHRMYRFQWEKAQDAWVLLYPEGMVKLNGPAGEILAEVDGSKTVSDLIATLQGRYPDATTLADDVVEFLQQALQQRWLELKEG